MVKSKQIFSAQRYLECITGKCYFCSSDDDKEFIQHKLSENGFALCSYPIDEIHHVVENGLNVVLVDCLVFDESSEEFENKYYWFEVTDEFNESEE